LDPILIIGAGLAGWTTAREFRKLNTSTPVRLITADSGDFYAKPSLSNAFAQKREPAQLVTTSAARMAETLNVTLHAHTRVTQIDAEAHQIQTTQGNFSYSALVLATGAQAIKIPLAGSDAQAVKSVNSLDDFFAFHADLTKASRVDGQGGQRVLIMGAGLIGCEFANDLIVSGFKVTVVDPSASPIAALLPLELGQQLQVALSAQGVTWRFGKTVASVNYASADASAATTPDAHSTRFTVQLSDGETLPADVVLSAIGLRADVRLAQAAGLRCERGIVVNAYLQTSAADVYALGDAAQYANGRTLPYVMPIMQASKVLALGLAGQVNPLHFPVMPVAIKTPALPITIAAPAPGTAGQWVQSESNIWLFNDPSHTLRGFALAGPQTTRRAELQRKMTETD
jgi:rubredoxin-NAD+ reductase